MGRPRTDVGEWGLIKTERRADGRYTARGRVRDIQNKLRVVERSGDTAEAAIANLRAAMRAKAGKVEGAVLEGETPFRVLAAAFLSNVRKKRSATTYDRYRHTIEHVLNPQIGELPIRALTPHRLQLMFDELEAGGRQPGGLRSIRSPLSGALDLAVHNEVLRHNPVRSVALPSLEAAYATEALTEEQIGDLLDAASKDDRVGPLELHDFLVLMLSTGCRISEILGLRWDHVQLSDDWRECVLLIRKNAVFVVKKGVRLHDGKTKAANRDIIMTPMVREVMMRRALHPTARPDHPVFPVGIDFRHRDPSGVRALLKPIYAQVPAMAQVKQPTHIFRRTAAMMMYQQGLSPLEIANQLGHASVKMTMDVYLKRNERSERAVSALDFMSRRKTQLEQGR